MTPLRQKPHWAAPSSMKACWSGCGFSGVPRPSRVVTSSGPTALTGITQERTTCPRRMTVQEPHWAMPQTNLGPRRPSSSVRTESKGGSGTTSTVWDVPLTLRENLGIFSGLRNATLLCPLAPLAQSGARTAIHPRAFFKGSATLRCFALLLRSRNPALAPQFTHDPTDVKLAEREGFEPPIPFQVCPLSRRIVSTTHAPLRAVKKSWSQKYFIR